MTAIAVPAFVASQVSRQGQGYSFTPGIYSEAQVQGWRRVTEAVHAAGGRMVLQLWHVGRMSHASFHADGLPVAPSAIAPAARVWVAGDDGVGSLLDCPVPRDVAEFYRRLLGWPYAEGHEEDDPDGDGWLVLVPPHGGPRLALQLSDRPVPPWRETARIHLDIAVDDIGFAPEGNGGNGCCGIGADAGQGA